MYVYAIYKLFRKEIRISEQRRNYFSLLFFNKLPTKKFIMLQEPKFYMIYLDNAASTRVDEEAIKAMVPYFDEIYANPASVHDMGANAKKALEDARKAIAKKINSEPDEIIFTSSGTESNNIAIKGIAKALKNKKHIITQETEHVSVLNVCKALEKEGFNLTILKVDKEGFIDPKQLEKAMTKKTMLVSIMHANNEIGTLQDITKIGKICKKKGVYFHTDAVQSFCKEAIDVKKMNIDLMSLSSHKVHGSKGAAALYIKRGTKISSIMNGGNQEYSLRPSTENVSGIVGFAKAVSLFNAGHNKNIKTLRDHAISRILSEIEGARLNGSRDKRLNNNISLSFKNLNGETILKHLNARGIYVSTGTACLTGSYEASHVLNAIKTDPRYIKGTIRVSLSRFTTKKEIDSFIEILKEIIHNMHRIDSKKRFMC